MTRNRLSRALRVVAAVLVLGPAVLGVALSAVTWLLAPLGGVSPVALALMLTRAAWPLCLMGVLIWVYAWLEDWSEPSGGEVAASGEVRAGRQGGGDA